jgi:probable HAF family extracellular repeat protein
MKGLGTLGGDTGTTNWINDFGDIVGKSDLPGPAPQLHDAVLWKRGNMIDLGVLPGDACSNAYYVNSRGQVVGTSEHQALCGITGEHAFLWENGGPMIDLNTQIPPGANLQLIFAFAINDRGEIAGSGVPPGCAPQDYLKCGHAYVLIPCKRGENCKNVSLGDTNAVPAIASNRSERSENSRAKSATSLDKIRARIQRMHLPGQRAVPSD